MGCWYQALVAAIGLLLLFLALSALSSSSSSSSAWLDDAMLAMGRMGVGGTMVVAAGLGHLKMASKALQVPNQNLLSNPVLSRNHHKCSSMVGLSGVGERVMECVECFQAVKWMVLLHILAHAAVIASLLSHHLLRPALHLAASCPPASPPSALLLCRCRISRLECAATSVTCRDGGCWIARCCCALRLTAGMLVLGVPGL